jgi:signal transduction histidine kinase
VQSGIDDGRTDVTTELRLLHRVTRRMMEADTRERLFGVATAAASGLLGFEYNTIRRYDRRRDALVPVAASPALRRAAGERSVYERGESVQWEAFDAGELLVFQDVTAIDDDADRNGEGSMVVVPLSEYGVLTLGSPRSRSITDADRELARVFGANVETAIRRLEHVQQLRDREAQLEAKTERLDRFAGKVSHELRNPLNVLAGRLDRARETGDPEHLDNLEQSIRRMDRLIDDILTFSRTGDVGVEPEPVELGAVATDSWDAVKTPATQIRIESSATVVADADRLRQVFENLFRNAVEHGSTNSRPEADDAVEHAGSGVTVSVGTTGDGFYVADDGTGIDADERDRLANAREQRSAQSVGFGLVVVTEIVDRHGWSFAVTESVDGGARFEFAGVETQ